MDPTNNQQSNEENTVAPQQPVEPTPISAQPEAVPQPAETPAQPAPAVAMSAPEVITPNVIQPEAAVQEAPQVITPAAEAAPIAPVQPIAPQQPVFAPSADFSQAPGPIVNGQPGVPVSAAPAMSAGTKKAPLKVLLIALIAVVVIGGGSAAAYFGAVVPNKPSNILKSALVNALNTKQANFVSTSDISSSDVSAKVSATGAVDTTNKAIDANLNITISGATITVAARYVNNSVYVKVGDLSSIAGLAGLEDPSLTSVINSLSSTVSNKWISIDSTLLNEVPGASCVLNANWSASNADIKLLEDAYSKHPFATIVSSSSDTINGKKAEKLVVSIDDNKAASFAGGLNDLSTVKKFESCAGSKASSLTTPKGDGDKTPFTVWVDKSTKKIVRVDSKSTAQDAKSGTTGTSSTTISYGPVHITAPTGATPITTVLSQVESQFGGSFDPTTLFGGGTTTDDFNSSSALTQ